MGSWEVEICKLEKLGFSSLCLESCTSLSKSHPPLGTEMQASGPPPTASGQATVSLSLSGVTGPLVGLLRISICSSLTVWETHTRARMRCHHLYSYYYCWVIPKLLLALRLRRVEKVERTAQPSGSPSPFHLYVSVPHLPFTCIFQTPCVNTVHLCVSSLSGQQGPCWSRACTFSLASPGSTHSQVPLCVTFHVGLSACFPEL